MNILKDIPIKVSFTVGQRFNSQEKTDKLLGGHLSRDIKPPTPTRRANPFLTSLKCACVGVYIFYMIQPS